MISQQQFEKELDLIINNALREDIGDGDHSSLACISLEAVGQAKVLVKQRGVIAGVDFARMILHRVDPTLKIDIRISDGNHVEVGDVVMYIQGNSHAILKSERFMLNAMQRMSAIATKTREFVDLLQGTKTQILDTRKTTPGIRAIEKWAVKIGGGENHRFALYDMIMLKDNHIDFAGGIAQAIAKTNAYLEASQRDLKIIVEARSIDEVKQILACQNVHRILLDNFDYTMTKEAVELINGQCQSESSGNIDHSTVKQYALCGVDYVSSGALTHSVCNMDLSLVAIV